MSERERERERGGTKTVLCATTYVMNQQRPFSNSHPIYTCIAYGHYISSKLHNNAHTMAQEPEICYVPVISVVSVAIVIISSIIGVSPYSSAVVMLEISAIPSKERSTKGQSFSCKLQLRTELLIPHVTLSLSLSPSN